MEYCHIVEQDEIAYGDNCQIFEVTCILFKALFFLSNSLLASSVTLVVC